MTWKFVLKCNIKEKWLVDNNELIKALDEIFSVKIIFNWEIILIDKRRNKQETRQKELFWQCKLDTFVPHGLNERLVALEWISQKEAAILDILWVGEIK